MTTIADPRTHAVLLTPPGRGAIAVVQVIGPHAIEAVDTHFLAANGKPLAAQPPNAIRFGHWGSATGEEVVVIRRDTFYQDSILAPRSSLLEIHCHGGQAAAYAIVTDLEANGCTLHEWKAWLRIIDRDPIATEAQIALASAPTERTAAILLDQFHGALAKAIERIQVNLVRNDIEPAIEIIEDLLSRCELGLHLTTPWKVALAGPPNVGKSSLINAMLGYCRSIVFDQPGTTRDIVTAHTVVEGWPIELADTAGLRDSQDALETAGVNLTTDHLALADLVIFVSDASQPQDVKLAEALPVKRQLLVRNKADLAPGVLPTSVCMDTSAKTGQGIAALLSAVIHVLIPQPPMPEVAVPFTHSQRTALECAKSALTAGDAATARRQMQALLAASA